MTLQISWCRVRNYFCFCFTNIWDIKKYFI